VVPLRVVLYIVCLSCVIFLERGFRLSRGGVPLIVPRRAPPNVFRLDTATPTVSFSMARFGDDLGALERRPLFSLARLASEMI
jgi:hypothetical protein